MSDNSDDARDAIHDAIQKHAPRGEDALLTGWTLVAEWIDHDGDRWLSKCFAPSTSAWTAKGMWHEALNGEWPREDED